MPSEKQEEEEEGGKFSTTKEGTIGLFSGTVDVNGDCVYFFFAFFQSPLFFHHVAHPKRPTRFFVSWPREKKKKEKEKRF